MATTKGHKIINEIGRNSGRPYNFADIMTASHAARQAGTFTANDVADLLRWAYTVAIDAGGSREAIDDMRREYERSVSEIERGAQARIDEAEERADKEYERARGEFSEEISMAKDRADENEEKAEYYDNLEKNTPARVFWAIVDKDWREAMFEDVERIADDIESCGRCATFSGKLAI